MQAGNDAEQRWQSGDRAGAFGRALGGAAETLGGAVHDVYHGVAPVAKGFFGGMVNSQPDSTPAVTAKPATGPAATPAPATGAAPTAPQEIPTQRFRGSVNTVPSSTFTNPPMTPELRQAIADAAGRGDIDAVIRHYESQGQGFNSGGRKQTAFERLSDFSDVPGYARAGSSWGGRLPNLSGPQDDVMRTAERLLRNGNRTQAKAAAQVLGSGMRADADRDTTRDTNWTSRVNEGRRQDTLLRQLESADALGWDE